jgi:hypothetical protein
MLEKEQVAAVRNLDEGALVLLERVLNVQSELMVHGTVVGYPFEYKFTDQDQEHLPALRPYFRVLTGGFPYESGVEVSQLGADVMLNEKALPNRAVGA